MKRRKINIIFTLLIILSIVILASCSVKTNKGITPEITEYITPILTSTPDPFTPTPTSTPTAETTPLPTPTPRSGPTVVGIYKKAGGSRQLVTDYVCKWVRGEDIATFNTYASNEELLNYASFRDMMEDCWFSFPNAKDYKIGYCLSYTLVSGEEISVIIKKPSDITHTEYLEVYLYDSVQQYKGGWYTHLSDDDMDEETLLYSFKLTPGVKIKEVETIKLKSFVYKYNDDSDFDPDTGEYIGTVSYEINIIKE